MGDKTLKNRYTTMYQCEDNLIVGAALWAGKQVFAFPRHEGGMEREPFLTSIVKWPLCSDWVVKSWEELQKSPESRSVHHEQVLPFLGRMTSPRSCLWFGQYPNF